MAWIKTIKESDAKDELKVKYDELIEPWGGVDNILKIHSLNPESLDMHVKTVSYTHLTLPTILLV